MTTQTDNVRDALRRCFTAGEGWLEYGVVEQRLRDLEPDLFAELVAEHGHRMFASSGGSSASRVIVRGLVSLRRGGELLSRPGVSTGHGWAPSVTYWTLDGHQTSGTTHTWAEMRTAQGQQASWGDGDRAGLEPPAVPTPRIGASPSVRDPLTDGSSQRALSVVTGFPVHSTYLRFSAEELLEHFVPTTPAGVNPQHLAVYGKQVASGGNSIEKDERFWVVGALLPVARSTDAVTSWAKVLTAALGTTPPMAEFETWAQALGGERRLYFEANLPSPVSYRRHLKDRVADRVLTPFQRKRAAASGVSLEGATKVDALLVCDTGFSVAFEAKVESDASPSITFDQTRNQIARNIDVLLEGRRDDREAPLRGFLPLRRPEVSCLVLLTPQLFKHDHTTRLYGWLYDAYKRTPSLLAKHLPHRQEDWGQVGQRLGWLSFEEVRSVEPAACGWLER